MGWDYVSGNGPLMCPFFHPPYDILVNTKWRWNDTDWGKSVPVPLCPPQIKSGKRTSIMIGVPRAGSGSEAKRIWSPMLTPRGTSGVFDYCVRYRQIRQLVLGNLNEWAEVMKPRWCSSNEGLNRWIKSDQKLKLFIICRCESRTYLVVNI
jgi:hypothetical protein